MRTPFCPPQESGDKCSTWESKASQRGAEQFSEFSELKKPQENVGPDLYLVKVIYVQTEGLTIGWWEGLGFSRMREAAASELHHLG